MFKKGVWVSFTCAINKKLEGSYLCQIICYQFAANSFTNCKRFVVPQLAILYSLDCPSQNIFDGPDVEGVDDREEGEEPFEDVEDVGDAEDK